ncbi:hypothetical protein LSH36_104g04026 [Paralvinella palmiformis]|uniref:Uncharacterized protein n=1 Tax=Paralvinella palmiformis TaxID=53620 RepID=A0AAD9JZG1_9ANNE|nr:hypothetical protein LSH36_104g04026 [Paralvinella palmiformis]
MYTSLLYCNTMKLGRIPMHFISSVLLVYLHVSDLDVFIGQLKIILKFYFLSKRVNMNYILRLLILLHQVMNQI